MGAWNTEFVVVEASDRYYGKIRHIMNMLGFLDSENTLPPYGFYVELKGQIGKLSDIVDVSELFYLLLNTVGPVKVSVQWANGNNTSDTSVAEVETYDGYCMLKYREWLRVFEGVERYGKNKKTDDLELRNPSTETVDLLLKKAVEQGNGVIVALIRDRVAEWLSENGRKILSEVNIGYFVRDAKFENTAVERLFERDIVDVVMEHTCEPDKVELVKKYIDTKAKVSFQGKKFVFTGHSDEIMGLNPKIEIVRRGGQVLDEFTPECDFLVINQKSWGNKKILETVSQIENDGKIKMISVYQIIKACYDESIPVILPPQFFDGDEHEEQLFSREELVTKYQKLVDIHDEMCNGIIYEEHDEVDFFGKTFWTNGFNDYHTNLKGKGSEFCYVTDYLQEADIIVLQKTTEIISYYNDKQIREKMKALNDSIDALKSMNRSFQEGVKVSVVSYDWFCRMAEIDKNRGLTQETLDAWAGSLPLDTMDYIDLTDREICFAGDCSKIACTLIGYQNYWNLESIIEERGGKCKRALALKRDYLVVGLLCEDDKTYEKALKNRSLGKSRIKIVPIQEFLYALELASPKTPVSIPQESIRANYLNEKREREIWDLKRQGVRCRNKGISNKISTEDT